ncbi:MAG: LysE family transporter [Chloroflexota bacterium]|nr:LysE family transporter [Chloroflexota bacterium]
MSVAFLLTAFIIVATPGTGVLYTLAAGLSRGARASTIAAVGCTLGIVPPMVAAIPSAARVIVSGILINILNPKLTIFFFAFLPQFVSAREPSAPFRMMELSAEFMLLTFVVFVGYGVFAASVRNHVISRPRVMTWMRRVFAGTFVALGAKLALAAR